MSLKPALAAMTAALLLTGCPAPWQGGSGPAVISGYTMSAQIADGVVTIQVPPDSASINAHTVVLEVRRNGEAIHSARERWNASQGLTVRLGSADHPVKDGDTVKFGLSQDGAFTGFYGGFFIPKAANTEAIDWVR